MVSRVLRGLRASWHARMKPPDDRNSGKVAMTIDARLESLCERVELVRGAGNRKRGQLCIMSFVALLAGEAHSDAPATASRTIRRFAIIINDEMPHRLRQRLKLFAPRILGTQDEHDQLRARLLIQAAREELLPRIATDFHSRLFWTITSSLMCQMYQKADSFSELRERVVLLSSCSYEGDAWIDCDRIANAVARLICECSRLALTQEQRDWYWMKAIDLLDRLCDVGSDERLQHIPSERMRAIADILERRNELPQYRVRAIAVLERVRKLIPALTG
jgi:hypothetical protein